MAEYWQNIRGILAKNAPPGPRNFWLGTARPSPIKFAGLNQFVKPEIYNPGVECVKTLFVNYFAVK